MKSDDFLLVVAVVAVVVAFVGVGITYNSLLSLRGNAFTGFASQSGTVNLSVESGAVINFTTDNINFGSGIVNTGQSSATLDSVNGVTNGNWTAPGHGFVVENIGNVNLTFNLATGKSAATFIGGTGSTYKYNVTNVESGSCAVVGFVLGLYNTVNTTAGGTIVCTSFGYNNGADTIRIDVQLVVPTDSFTGALGDTFTATIAAS